MNIEIFSSPGCSKCGHAKEILRKLVLNLNEQSSSDTILWREVNILDELDHAVELGVMSTPSIAIDGELIFTSLPSVNKLRIELENRLNLDANTLNDPGSQP